MANESSSSDEETNEQKETMFKKAASSAGSECHLCVRLYDFSQFVDYSIHSM